MVRLRFAPSPTGYLHVGGARTALFNWLYARRHRGTFVLRIEDTDTERSSWDMVSGIVDGLRWLGLDWDEGPDVGGPHEPYFQSQRLEKYRAMAERLVADGHASYCYCSPDAIKAKREAAEAAGGGWIYDRTCCARSPDDIATYEATGAPRAIRFRVPEGQTVFADLVHGPIEFDNRNIEDFVILRSDRQPTYHLSVVVDDVDMQITHVVRGDDHISNTPKQVLLYGAFGAATPAFAHVPLILGPDKKRLSKRHGATSVTEYQRLGYTPEAMVNFLSLLGWSPGGDQELFSRDELVERFTLDGISGGNAVFNPDKLDWFNQQHISRLDGDTLLARVGPVLEGAGLVAPERAYLLRVLNLVKSRVKRLGQFVDEAKPFLLDIVEFDGSAASKHLSTSALRAPLVALVEGLLAVQPFEAAELEKALRAVADAHGIKAASLIHATRVAVTGRAVSPGLFDVLEVLGRDRVVGRLREAMRILPE